MIFRPEDVISDEMIRQLLAVLPEASTVPGSVLREAFINSPASQISLLFREVESARVAQTINEATGNDLDRIAANYGLTRETGESAIGSLTLVFTNTIVSTEVNISSGTIVSTDFRSEGSIDFRIIGELTFRPIDIDFYEAEAYRQSSTLQAAGIADAKYSTTVSIEALRSGSEGNVGANTIIRSNIPGIRAVVNLLSTTGGTDVESDESLRRRISLVLSGSNTGTEEGLIALARGNPNVTAVSVVRPGDSLMTRDGSVYDEDGNLVTEGTGRDVDVYIKGSQFLSRIESFVFTDNANGATVSTANNLVLGYDEALEEDFAFQPIGSVTSLTGSVTGSNFKVGQEIVDDEGNVILDGNYILLKDHKADSYNIVKENSTGEIKVAAYLSPASNNYSVLEQLQTGDKSNSALGSDGVFFLTNVVTIEQEVVTRGYAINGSDSLAHSSVAKVKEVYEEVSVVNESIVVGEDDEDGFVVYTKHTPIVDVTQVRNARLGQTYSFEITDATAGKLRLLGRFPPQVGDVVQVSYVWRQARINNVEYFLQGDSIKWSRPPYEQSPGDGFSLLDPTTLETTLDLQIQPLVPTYLALEMKQLTARGQYNVTLVGDKARIISNEGIEHISAPSFDTDDFVFSVPATPSATATSVRLGRVLSVRNLTQGFEYDLEGISLNTNIYDSAAFIESDLGNNQFTLNVDANSRQLEVGDQILLSRRALAQHWTTTSDFSGNIGGNSSPTYDSVTTNISDDMVTVRRHEDDTTSTTTTLAGSITESGILSGIVNIIDDVVIESGTTVIIRPNTVIRFRESSALNSLEAVQEQVELNNGIVDTDIETATDIEENVYIFQQPALTTSPFFIILNDTGTESFTITYQSNTVRQVVVTRDGFDFPATYEYYIEDRLVPTEFIGTVGGQGLLAAITNHPATFLGYRRLEIDSTITFVTKATTIEGQSQYGVLLTETPNTTGLTIDDFSLYQSSDPEAVFSDISYNSDRNVFLIDGLALIADYLLDYFVSVVTRLSLTVKGILQTSADTTEDTPITFTSAAADPAPGDWEGIIFDPLSRQGAPGNANIQSFLSYCIIKHSRIGIRNKISDPAIGGCTIKNNSDTGYSVTSSSYYLAGVTRPDLRLLSNDFNTDGRSYLEDRTFTSPAGTSTRTLSLELDNLLVTDEGRMPTFTKVGTLTVVEDIVDTEDFLSKYLVEFNAGTDYNVYVDGTAILPGVDADFAIEYDDRRDGFLLSFFNTALTTAFMASIALNPGYVTIDYYVTFYNGSITDCIFTKNGNSAIDIDQTSFVSLDNNTVEDNGFYGITVNESYAALNNNIITGYTIAPVLQDATSVISAKTNNMWSLSVAVMEQTEISGTDALQEDINSTDTIIEVVNSYLFSRGFVIKIDEEFMEVSNVLGDRIEVIRGENNTTPTAHSAGAVIYIQRTRAIFTVTGIPGEYCQIREVTSDGALIAQREPVTMRRIADNTFRVAFSIDRTGTFYYRYQYKNDLLDSTWTLSNTRRFFSYHFGSSINNFINPNHEVDILFGSTDSTNTSDNPLYEQPDYENFRIPDNSPSSINNPVYATPYDPSVQYNRLIGRQAINQNINLLTGASTIALENVPIVVTSLQDDIIVQLASNTSRTLSVASYDNSTNTLTLTAPVSSSQVGTYEVIYNTPITLGSSLTPFPHTTSLTYQFDEGRVVDFTKIIWNESGSGGNVKVRYRTADSAEDLIVATYSDYDEESSFDLSFGTGVFPRGSAIEFEVVIETNDAGYESDGTPIFPKLLDLSLYLTPARDNVPYVALELEYDSRDQTTIVTIEDSENQGSGIRNSTFTTIGADEALSVIIRKAEDGFVESKEYVLGEAEAIATNDTILKIKGDLTILRTEPSANDEIVADYILVDVEDSEIVTFVEQGVQITKDRFFKVSQATTQIVIDQILASPAGENLSINSMVQPISDTQYLVNYTFAAPADGETITVNYSYDDVVRSVAQDVEVGRVLTSDTLVRAAIEVSVRIEASIFISNGFSANAVLIDISNGLSQFFSNFTGFGGEITPSEIEAVIGSVAGVDVINLSVLSRTPASVVETITLSDREVAILEVGSPILTIAATTSPDTPLASNS